MIWLHRLDGNISEYKELSGMKDPQPSHLWTASVSAAKVGVMTYVNAQCRRNHLRVESAWVHRAPDLFQDIPGLRFGNIGKLKISKSMKISREKIKHCRFLVENIWLPLRLGPTWDPHPRHLWAVRWSGLALERSSNMAAVIEHRMHIGLCIAARIIAV